MFIRIEAGKESERLGVEAEVCKSMFLESLPLYGEESVNNVVSLNQL